MEQATTYTDVVTSVLQLMRNTFQDQMKAYYEGDPLKIPVDNLPCIIVDQTAIRARQDATSSDDLRSEVRIKIVYDKRPDFDASDDVDMTERKLRRLIEGRHPQTGSYLKGTLLEALRTHMTLGGTTLGMDVDVKYDLQPRPGGLITSEAQASVMTTERVIRGNEAASV